MNILGLQKTTLLDYPGHIASTIFTGGCNFRCPYCHNGDIVVHPEELEAYSEEEIFEHLNKRQATLTGICVTGGEPTLQENLYQFLTKLKENFNLPIKLDTNGSDPGLLQLLVSCKLIDYVAMDIKSSKEKYSSIANQKSFSIEPIIASVDYLKSNAVPYEFRTTLAEELHDENDIRSIGKWLSGANQYYLQPYKESEQVIHPVYHPHHKETLEHFRQILLETIPIVEIRGLD